MPKIPTLEEMLKAGMHFGHQTSKWHPKMEPFIFTQRNRIHIIDLVKTQQLLATTLDFIKKLASEDKVVLFVGTKAQAKEPVKKLSKATDMPYVVGKWIGGTLTNFPVIKKLIKKYTTLVEQKQAGKLSKYTKKEQLDFDREIDRLEERVGGLVNLAKFPDAVFIWDAKKEKNAIAEATKKNIPIIAVCDTNVNPGGIKYIIPANDDATKTIKLVLRLVKEAIEEGKKNKSKKT